MITNTTSSVMSLIVVFIIGSSITSDASAITAKAVISSRLIHQYVFTTVVMLNLNRLI